MLFGPALFFLPYNSRLTLQVPVDQQTNIWIMTLTGYVVMASAIFFNNARDEACPCLYTCNVRFDPVGDELSLGSH